VIICWLHGSQSKLSSLCNSPRHASTPETAPTTQIRTFNISVGLYRCLIRCPSSQMTFGSEFKCPQDIASLTSFKSYWTTPTSVVSEGVRTVPPHLSLHNVSDPPVCSTSLLEASFNKTYCIIRNINPTTEALRVRPWEVVSALTCKFQTLITRLGILYARVTEYRQWILNTVTRNSCNIADVLTKHICAHSHEPCSIISTSSALPCTPHREAITSHGVKNS